MNFVRKNSANEGAETGELRVSGVLLAGEWKQKAGDGRGPSQPSLTKISRAEHTLGYLPTCSLLGWFRGEMHFPSCPKIKTK